MFACSFLARTAQKLSVEEAQGADVAMEHASGDIEVEHLVSDIESDVEKSVGRRVRCL